jgi:vacuolar-type H+-ATPase subunit I/STV1
MSAVVSDTFHDQQELLAERDQRIAQLEEALAKARASIAAKVEYIDVQLRELEAAKRWRDSDVGFVVAEKETEIVRLQTVVRNQQGRIDRELDRAVQQQQRSNEQQQVVAGPVSELELRVDELEGENDRLRAVATALAVLGGLVS